MILITYSPEKPASEKVAKYALKEFMRLEGAPDANGAEYLHDENGAPYFSGEDMPYVSVSHSGDYVVAAVSRFPVGIDVQRQKSIDFKSVCRRFDIDASDEKSFYEKFAAAEAKTKALRTPLAESLKSDNSDVAVFGFIPGYTLALFGEGTPFFTEYFPD